jgi:hypothetical protein
LLLILVSTLFFGYIVLIQGWFDRIVLSPHRPALLQELNAASQEEPPDVMSIIDALYEPDWHIAAIAAEHIRLLHQSQKLTDSQEDLAIEALLEALGSNGHWWRFGWDREEAQFERFRGSAIVAVAGFGAESVDDVLAASYNGNPFQREAACWIFLEMVKDETASIENLEQIHQRLDDLAEADRNFIVRKACGYVQLQVRDE